MTKNRRWLYVLLAGGLIAIGAGGGTFATFNAAVTNKTNTFSTGSLTLHENGTCKSTSVSPTNVATCSTVKITASKQVPGAVYFETLKLGNTGTLTPSTFELYASGACVNTKSTTLAALNASAKLCTQLALFVEKTQSTTSPATLKCEVGGTCPETAELTVGLTSATSGTTLALKTKVGTFAAGTVWITNTTTGKTETFTVSAVSATKLTITKKAVVGTFPAGSRLIQASSPVTSAKTFTTSHLTSSAAVALTPVLASKKEQTFRVGVYLPSTTNNTFQGLTAKFGLTWRITQ